MKKQLLKSMLMAVVGVGMMAGGAMAEPTLQNILDTKTDTGLIVGVDESGVEAWTSAEANVDAYLVSLNSAATGNLYIYGLSNPVAGYLLGSFSGTNLQSSFSINETTGNLKINGTTVAANFGESFGFYWETGNGKSYTQNEYNIDQQILAKTFVVKNGKTVTTLEYDDILDTIVNYPVTAQGNNDWIVAFEDWGDGAVINGVPRGDGDYQDAVFYVEDMNPVPEPATMLLFGTGIAGLAGIARRRKAN